MNPSYNPNLPPGPYGPPAQNIEPFVVEASSSTHLTPFDPFESIALNQPNFNANFDDFAFLSAPKTLQRLPDVISWKSDWSAEDLGKRCDQFYSTSSQHASFLVVKQQQEGEAQHMHNNVWTFPIQQRQNSAMCGDGRPVTYVYSVRVAVLNDHLFGVLNMKFNELHALNINSIFSTLYDQTIAELQLSNYIHACLPTLKSDARQLKATLDQLFDLFSNTRKPISAHSANTLRQLLLYLGSLLLDMSPQSEDETQQASESVQLISFDDTFPRPADISSIIPSVSTYFFTKLMSVQGCSWGISLVQPSSKEIILFKWFELLFVNTATVYEENEYLLLIGQIPWRHLTTVCTVDEVKKCILFPIQKALEILAPRGYVRLMLALAKIVGLLSCSFNGLLVQGFAVLTRSPWPCKMLLSPVFTLLPWKVLQPDELSVVFCELYHLFSGKLRDYAGLPDDKRVSHRTQFRDYLIMNQGLLTQVYQCDMPLADVIEKVRFPLFRVFASLALASLEKNSSDTELAKVVATELFYFAFVCPGSPAPNAPPNDPMMWMPYLRTEASQQLARLCKYYSQAHAWVINAIGQALPVVNPQQIEYFYTNQATLSNWKVDLGSLNWLSYFMAHRALPQSMDPDGTKVATLFVNTFLLSNPQVQFAPNVSANGLRIGSKILTSINWSIADATTRMIAILVLLASKSVNVNQEWLWATLSSPSVGGKLLSPPFDDFFMQRILGTSPGQLACEDELVLVQVMCSISMVQLRPVQQNFKWLEDWGLYSRLDVLLTRMIGRGISTQNLLLHVMQVLKLDAFRTSLQFSKCLASAQGKNNQNVEDLRVLMVKTLSFIEDHDKWIQLWALTLCARVPQETGFCVLLDALVYGMFCESVSLDIITQTLFTRQIPKRDILKLQEKYIWLSYAAAFTHQPLLPADVSALTNVNEANFQKALKESRFWLWKELALSIKDGLVALPFWEQFFLIYFEATVHSPAVGLKLVNGPLRDQLTKHFTTVAQHYYKQNKVYTLYYSFTTWSKDVVLAEFPRVFCPENPAIYEALLADVPPPYIVSVSSEMASSLSQEVKNLNISEDKKIESPLKDPSFFVNQLLVLLPRKIVRYQATGNETEPYVAFQHEVEHIASALEQDKNDDESSATTYLIEEMKSLFTQYYQHVQALKSIDDKFLELTRQLYFNYSETFQVPVQCNYGTNCARKAIVQGTSVRIGPAYATVREDIAKNREEFNKVYGSFFTIAKNMAYKQTAAEYLRKYLIQPGVVRPNAGVRLFFSCAEMLLSSIAPLEVISRKMFEITKDLGNVYIKDKTEYQKRLLKSLLTYKKPQSPMANAEKYLSYLFDCFTPAAHLVLDKDRKSYMDLLAILAITETTLPEDQEKVLAARFEVANNFTKILAESTQPEIDRLFKMLPPLMYKASLNVLTSTIVQSLITFQFPLYLQQVMDTILAAVLGGTVTQSWNTFFSSVRFEALDASMAQKLLNTLSSQLPLPDQFMGSAIELSRSIMLDIPAFVQELLEENDTRKIFSGGGAPTSSPLWSDIKQLVQAILKPYKGQQLSNENFGLLLALLRDLVTTVCSPLINRMWYLFQDVIRPYIVAAKPDLKLVHDCFAKLPWFQADFHCFDMYVVRSMLETILVLDPRTVCIVFSKLDWKKFVEFVTYNTEQAPSEAPNFGQWALFYLQLAMYVNMLDPNFIPTELRPTKNELPYLMDWKKTDITKFDEVFTGASFTELLCQGLGSCDPSKALMDNINFLSDLLHNQPQLERAACSLILEARSVMFFSVQRDAQSKQYWTLPYVDQVTLLTTIMIPMARIHTKSEKAASQILVAVFSCLNHIDVWPVPRLLNRPAHPAFFNTGFIPGVANLQAKPTDAELKSFKEFSTKVLGIIAQFAASLEERTALEILNVAAQTITIPERLVQILEDTLHSFFGQTQSVNPSADVLSNFQLPSDMHWVSFAEICIAHQAPLTLRFVLEEQKRSLADDVEPFNWTVSVCHLVEYAIKFVPAVTHFEMDVLALWFFVLDLVADERWNMDKQSQEKLDMYVKFLQGYAGLKNKLMEKITAKTKKVELQLASRACLLFLSKLLVQKKGSKRDELGKDVVEETKKLNDLQDKILQSRNDPIFQPYAAFFTQVETFLSPLCTVKDFKLTLVRILAPIYPYLEKTVANDILPSSIKGGIN